MSKIYFDQIYCIYSSVDSAVTDTTLTIFANAARDIRARMAGRTSSSGLDLSDFGELARESKFVSDIEDLYVTYANTPQASMVFPIKGGTHQIKEKDRWYPDANEGNPAIAGGDTVTYYFWDYDSRSDDDMLGTLTINLKQEEGTGPHMQLVCSSDDPGNRNCAIYLVEYRVLPS